MNCQFPYKRSILCQCLKINWNNICCYYINLIYNVCVFYYYCCSFVLITVRTKNLHPDIGCKFFVLCVSWFLLFVHVTMGCQHCWANGFFGSLSYLTNKYACLLAYRISSWPGYNYIIIIIIYYIMVIIIIGVIFNF